MWQYYILLWFDAVLLYITMWYNVALIYLAMALCGIILHRTAFYCVLLWPDIDSTWLISLF